MLQIGKDRSGPPQAIDADSGKRAQGDQRAAQRRGNEEVEQEKERKILRQLERMKEEVEGE